MNVIRTDMNNVLIALDASYKREKALRKVIDELFLIICKKCSEAEIQQISCLDTLKELAEKLN